MAAYFHGNGSEIQSSDDGLQTLYLMNPNNYVTYTDNAHHPAAAPPNMFFLNPTVPSNARDLLDLSHAPPPSSNQPLFGITLPANMVGSSNKDDPGRSSLLTHHEISGVQGLSAPRGQYHLWGPVIDQTASPMAGTGTATPSSCTMDVASQMGFRRPNQQGLSLSLSSQQTVYRSLSGETDVPGHRYQFPAPSPTNGDRSSHDDNRVIGNSSSSVSNGITDMQKVFLGSKYLKVAQELLDEVVNVGKVINKAETEEAAMGKMKMENEDSKEGIGDVPYGTSENNLNKQGSELTTAQRQELQMKKTKLVSMLDEVEQRYRQYRQQIQMVVSSFEQAAGLGAAKSYTSLALKTISKQFRCLKDAISSQIKATSKSLGEDHCIGAKIEGSRLRFVDHHLRQQRAMQQLGIIHHNAWRPQRGLPERAVSVLRAWLFEHFLHPYPKDSDKVLLAQQTGLTRSQVSNWFINARVRLWKPMVEEMYMEETKEQEHKHSDDSSRLKESNKELPSIATMAREPDFTGQNQMKAVQSKPEMLPHQKISTAEVSISSMSTSLSGGCLQSQSGFNLLGSGDMQRSPNKMQNSPSSILSVYMEMKPGETNRDVGVEFGINRQSKGGYSLMSETPDQGSDPFEPYSVGDIGRFNSQELTPRFHGNGVSLTLGLPHSENLSLRGNQHGIGYLPLQNMQLGRLEIGATGTEFCAINTPQSSYSSNGFDNIDIQNRKGFAAQLLPDFVAR